MFLRILRYIWQVFAFGPVVLFNYFHWMIRYSRNPQKYPLELRYKRVRRVILYVLKVFLVKFHIEGLENVEKVEGNFLIMPNHRSNFDPVALIAMSPRPITFVSKHEARKYPFIGRCIRALEGAFFDRGDLRQQLKMMRVIEQDMLEHPDRNWVIFPEGTRNKNTEDLKELLPFHHGSFRVPMNNDFTIIPASINGTPRILSLKYNPRVHVECVFGTPFKPSEIEGLETSKELAEYTQGIVQENLNRIVDEDEKYRKKKKVKKTKKLKEPELKEE